MAFARSMLADKRLIIKSNQWCPVYIQQVGQLLLYGSNMKLLYTTWTSNAHS